MAQIQPDDILREPFWPEKIRVISVKLVDRDVMSAAWGHYKPEEEISIVRYVVKNWKDRVEMAR